MFGFVRRLGRWQKQLGAVVTIAGALFLFSGWIDHGLGWYLQRSALAGDLKQAKEQISNVERKVDNISRLSLQKQEIDLSKEINYYEKIERSGRISQGEDSYLAIIRQQREAVRQELRNLPPVTR